MLCAEFGCCAALLVDAETEEGGGVGFPIVLFFTGFVGCCCFEDDVVDDDSGEVVCCGICWLIVFFSGILTFSPAGFLDKEDEVGEAVGLDLIISDILDFCCVFGVTVRFLTINVSHFK